MRQDLDDLCEDCVGKRGQPFPPVPPELEADVMEGWGDRCAC